MLIREIQSLFFFFKQVWGPLTVGLETVQKKAERIKPEEVFLLTSKYKYKF